MGLCLLAKFLMGLCLLAMLCLMASTAVFNGALSASQSL